MAIIRNLTRKTINFNGKLFPAEEIDDIYLKNTVVVDLISIEDSDCDIPLEKCKRNGPKLPDPQTGVVYIVREYVAEHANRPDVLGVPFESVETIDTITIENLVTYW